MASSSSSSWNQNNQWTRYYTYRDCSQGICSIYCSQWCYMMYPPPPPSSSSSSFGDGNTSYSFSPTILAIIGVIATIFLLVSYFTLISKYCARETNEEANSFFGDHVNGETCQNGSKGLDESIIKSIMVCKYKKNDGFVEEADCCVCLSEFIENERLRLLPKCSHAFHIHCIDEWLKFHSSCPLCRDTITPEHIIIIPQEHEEEIEITHEEDRLQDNVVVEENVVSFHGVNEDEKTESEVGGTLLSLRRSNSLKKPGRHNLVRDLVELKRSTSTGTLF